MFLGEKSEAIHLRIFSCPVYMHAPKDKRSKLEPSGKNEIFFGYNESLKACRVYIPGYKQIETRRDVTFDEDTTFSGSKNNHSDEVPDEEHEAPRVTNTGAEEYEPEDHDMAESQKHEDPLQEMITYKRRPTWDHEIIQDCREVWCFRCIFHRKKKTPNIF